MDTQKLNTYTADLYTLVKHTLKAIKAQKDSKQATNSRAIDLLHGIEISLTEQISQFENLDRFDDDSLANNIKDTLASVSGTIAGKIDSAREDTVSKMLRDDYTSLSMIASGYTMLHTAALGADDQELADFTQSSLKAIAQLITETSKEIPHVVAEELDIEDIAEQAENNTQEAWFPEEIMA